MFSFLSNADTYLNIIFDYVRNIFDIICVAFIIYLLISIAKKTKTLQMIWGLSIIILIYFITDALRLYTTNFIFDRFLYVVPLVLVLLFLPDIRRFLEGFGNISPRVVHTNTSNDLVVNVVSAVNAFSKSKTGSLIVFERNNPLDDIIATGIPLDSDANGDLLRTIFYEGTPLHDGAVIIRDNRIVAAACTLPLTTNKNFTNQLHTRHKAAIGVTERYDALVVVVSEETGIISVAMNGSLNRHLNPESLYSILEKELIPKDKSQDNKQNYFFKLFHKEK